MSKRTLWHSDTLNRPHSYILHRSEQMEVADEKKANLVSSLLANGKHSPLLDLDVSHRVIPSTTKGHGHLYIDGVELPWWKYRVMLAVLSWCGVIERNYYKHSVKRKMTMVRAPGVKKPYATFRGRLKRFFELELASLRSKSV